jgi:Cu(I)/Ag(I) efflux system periplasmic protein CusF
MNSRRGATVFAVASLVLAGCAGYQLAPLASSHPANPAAPAAPEQPPSRTLAYAPADIPPAVPVQAVSPAMAAQPGRHESPPADTAASATVVGEGVVVATVPKSSQIVVEHGEIKGFMEAMTMGYRIDPPSLLAGLTPGDKVRFTIDVQKRAIVEIEKLK